MPNRLAQETSPYLRQHADNPVDWYAWGEEALERARAEDKPILLSIGYSACHWCHVMAHESFEDPDVAAVMNALFVNVKIDREERPDLDQIYQAAHQMFNQRGGGWPLTAFLTPGEHMPFFVGTYFPKAARYGMPAFPQLLERVERYYREHKADIARQNESIAVAFQRMREDAASGDDAFSGEVVAEAIGALKQSFDSEHGGFGGAPKFPHPTDLELLVRRYAATGDKHALHVATLTLERMAEGGIYDQLGGGFCRYSVDATWTIPHFEKMLYDNGPLLRLYAEAWAATGRPLFARVAEETAGWLMREMQSPEGGYYSSLDADSEHEEGKFYVWTPREVQALLTAEEYAVAAPHYGLDGQANFEGKHWHLAVVQPLKVIAAGLGRSEEECAELLDTARQKLFAARAPRVRPGLDDKVLVSWNALAIRGMARAASVFGRDDWLASARRALDFVRRAMWKDGALLATYKDTRAHLNAYLDDYAFLLDALIELLQADFRGADLAFALELAEALLARFEDQGEGAGPLPSRAGGGFFFTSHDHERLIHRPKPGHDNATPSGNGVAAFALARLGHLAGEPRYLDAARRAVAAFYPAMQRYPGGFGALTIALEECLAPPEVIVLRGPTPRLRPWLKELAPEFRPHSLLVGIDGAEGGLPPALDKPAAPGRVNAYVCRGVTCLEPVSQIDALRRLLGGAGIK
ncbi:MAG TPA: thioredoxin domain-containing protein [Burkholderiales bacterium]|nr:thioredoxin domain-containing protein [Burkholderiales bacterium]